jgi:hypothetical protein
LQEHKLAGSNPLKKEVRLLLAQISFAKQCLETPASRFSKDDIKFAISGSFLFITSIHNNHIKY